jgi:hypothetical protein
VGGGCAPGDMGRVARGSDLAGANAPVNRIGA